MGTNRKNSFKYILCFILLILGITSCQQSDVYSHYEELKNAEWRKNQVLAFDVDSSLFEVNKAYDISIDINNNVKYDYQNIWLLIDHTLNSDSSYTRVDKEYQLADSAGHWLGGGFAFIYQLSVPLISNYTFKEKRRYRFEIRHGMQDEKLKGLEKIGVRITERN